MSSAWLVRIEWASGKLTTAGFSSEAAAVAWAAGRVDEIERNRWDAEIRVFKRLSGFDRPDPVYRDVTDEYLPGGPLSPC